MTATVAEGRTCTRCGKWRDAAKFKRASGTDRLRANCRACDVASNREYRNRPAARMCSRCGVSYQTRNGQSVFCQSCGEAARLANLTHPPKATLVCRQCGGNYQPDRLSRQFCSVTCKGLASRGRKRITVSSPQARSAHAEVATEIRGGRLTRPPTCQQCRAGGKVEAAHFDYGQPLEIRWLCVSCHRRWDKAEPKGGTSSVILRRAEAQCLAVEKAG